MEPLDSGQKAVLISDSIKEEEGGPWLFSVLFPESTFPSYLFILGTVHCQFDCFWQYQ